MEHLDRMTSSGCKTYLLLLKEFSKYEESFDPALVRIMLARAERRYIHYLAIVAYDSGVYKHSIERITIAPPLDVAIIWHAHMVNPSRYYEDVIRFHQSHLPKAFVPAESSALETDKLFNTHFPLHAMFSKDGTFVKGQTSVRAWEEMFDGVDEPYHLTPGNVSQGTTTVECCFCGVCMECSWADYAEWRCNPNCTIQCCNCHRETSTRSSSIARLTKEIANPAIRLPSRTDKNQSDAIKNVLHFGFAPSQAPDRTMENLFDPNDTLEEIHARLEGYVRKLKERDRNSKIYLMDFFHVIREHYYGNPFPFSVDLVNAAIAQRPYITHAAKNSHWTNPLGFDSGIVSYKVFMKKMKSGKYCNRPRGEIVKLPNFESFFIWHLNMLQPLWYEQFWSDFMCVTMEKHDVSVVADLLSLSAVRPMNATSWMNKKPLENAKSSKIMSMLFGSKHQTSKKTHVAHLAHRSEKIELELASSPDPADMSTFMIDRAVPHNSSLPNMKKMSTYAGPNKKQLWIIVINKFGTTKLVRHLTSSQIGYHPQQNYCWSSTFDYITYFESAEPYVDVFPIRPISPSQNVLSSKQKRRRNGRGAAFIVAGSGDGGGDCGGGC